MLLAGAGAKVRVVERLGQVGGRTSSLEADGFRFDLGPTFFLYPKVLESIFAAVGRNLHDEVELVRLDPQYRVAFGSGGHLDATPDPEEMERQIRAIAPGDAGGFRRFLTENRRKLEQFAPCLESFVSRLARCGESAHGPAAAAAASARIAGYLAAPLSFAIRASAWRFPFSRNTWGCRRFAARAFSRFFPFSSTSTASGIRSAAVAAVTQAMARVAEEMGVEICLEEPVEEILFQGKRATGVRTAAGTSMADAVVINADFAQAMKRLVPDRLRRRWTDRKLTTKKYSCSTFMMYLGIEGQYDLPHHSIYISKNYEQNLDEIERRHVLSEDPSFYVQNACVTDPSLAPAGMSTLYALAPVTQQHPNVDWRQERARFRALLLRQMERAGYEGVEKRIRFERVLTPADWEHDHQIYRGATFNLAHTLGQMLHLRPRNRFEDLDGVYLTGGGTHPGSGLPVIFESARITSRLLLQDFGLPFPQALAAPALEEALA